MNIYIARGKGVNDLIPIAQTINANMTDMNLLYHDESRPYNPELVKRADICIMFIKDLNGFGRGLFEQLVDFKQRKIPVFIIGGYTPQDGVRRLYRLNGEYISLEKLAGEDYNRWGKLCGWGVIDGRETDSPTGLSSLVISITTTLKGLKLHNSIYNKEMKMNLLKAEMVENEMLNHGMLIHEEKEEIKTERSQPTRVGLLYRRRR